MYQIIKVNGEFIMREVYFVPWVPSKQIDLEPTSEHSSAPVLQVPVILDSGAEERKLLCQEARSYKLALAAELARSEKYERLLDQVAAAIGEIVLIVLIFGMMFLALYLGTDSVNMEKILADEQAAQYEVVETD